MHFVLAVVSCSCSLLFLREIKRIAGQDTTKEYVCLHTTGRCLCYRQLITDRPRDRLQLLISRPALQDVQEEMQILFLIQIEAWDKSDSKNKFQTSNKGQLGNIKKGKTSILRKFFFKIGKLRRDLDQRQKFLCNDHFNCSTDSAVGNCITHWFQFIVSSLLHGI